jgi:Ca2+-binding EF-hand superfamily protein
MADVWVLQGISGPGGDLELHAVVLGNRKILTQSEGIKEELENAFEAAERIMGEGNEGEISTEELFEFLSATHNNVYGIGTTVSSEEARELVKKNGGI